MTPAGASGHLLVVCVLALVASCNRPRPIDDFVRGGVRIRKVHALQAPIAERSTVALMPGDFVITSAGLRIVIGGEWRKPEMRGAVLEAVSEGISPFDGVSLLAQALYVRGSLQRIAVLDMQIIERAGMPALRIDGLVHVAEQVIDVQRELSVAGVGDALSVATRMVSRRDEPDVRFGARVVWGGSDLAAPGIDTLADDRWHTADWVGSRGATGSTLFGFADGQLSLRARYEHRGGSSLLQDTEIVHARRAALSAGTPRYEKALLAVTESGVGRSVRRLGFWRGKPFAEAWARLPYRPKGSEVSVVDGQGRFVVSARPDVQGRVVMPLPARPRTQARFTAVAVAYGHGPSDPYSWTADERARFELVIPAGGRIRVRARDDRDDSALPVRVRLLPLKGTPALALGPDHRASGAGDTVTALVGDLSIAVPAGRYRAVVTHGPEWSMYETEIQVSDTFSPRVAARLRHQVDPGAWVACDLHVHAAPSPDSDVTLEDRLISLHAEGVRFAVATDHNHVTDYAPTAQRIGLHDFDSMTGVEITTEQPAFGHFNAYPYPLDPNLPDNGAPEATQLDAVSLFQSLHALDPMLVVQVNHPRSEGGIGYFDVMGFDAASGVADARFSAEFDALEVWNGFDLARPEQTEQVFRDWMAILKRGRRVVATGSSDSHQVRYQLAGYPRTYANVTQAGVPEPRAVVRAIKAGATFVTSGPFLEASIDDVGPGGTAVARSGFVRLDVRVRMPDWMSVERLEVFVDGELAFDRRVRSLPDRSSERMRRSGALRVEERGINLPIEKDTFVIVRVSSSHPLDRFFGRNNILPAAFTNPIFVDADGDGDTPWSSVE